MTNTAERAEREHLADPLPLRVVLAEVAARLGIDWGRSDSPARRAR